MNSHQRQVTNQANSRLGGYASVREALAAALSELSDSENGA